MVVTLAATSFLAGFQLGPIFAIAQTVAKPSMRALASAIMLLMAAGFGQGVGPLAVGMLTRRGMTLALTPCAIRCSRPPSPACSAHCCSSGRHGQSEAISSGRADPGSPPPSSPCFHYYFYPRRPPHARIDAASAACM
jgi:hypothetical protein